MKKVVFILGTGHCGSTLLDLILSSHTQAFGLGAISALKNEADLYRKPGAAFCNIHEDKDTFWTEEIKAQLLRYIRPRPLWRMPLKKVLPSLDDQLETRLRTKAYEYMFEATGKSILTDSSKNPRWISLSARGVEQSYTATPYVIYLSRDGRAVINAYRRKYAERGVATLSQQWMDKVQTINRFYEAYAGAKYWLKYEDLASQPEATMQAVCRFLDIEYEPTMLRFWEHDHHLVGGNHGTKSLISKFKYNRLVTTDADKGQHYGNHALGIQLDERWKQELTADNLAVIEENISVLNQPLKYSLS